MMRLPRFRYLAPRSLAEAVAALGDLGPDAAPLAGGTDLLPNMKRRQQTPATVVGCAASPTCARARAIPAAASPSAP